MRFNTRGLLLVVPLLLNNCHDDQQSVLSGSFQSMGTTIYVRPEIALDVVQEIFERVDWEMSEWKESSLLTSVNDSAGMSAVRCSDDLFNAIQLSVELATLTDGAFDPTWASLWDIWDFNSPRLPSEQEIKSRLLNVNWKLVELDKTNNSVYLHRKGMALGLGGIAKGIALNQAREALKEMSIVNYMITAGGQVLAQGSSRRVGIRKPDGLPLEFIAIVELKNASISTSGDYENYFEIDGIRYHHIIDPRTGYPARGTKSVTVVAEDAALADALSTGLFVMGPVKAIELVNTLQGVEAFIIDGEGNQYFSERMQELIVQ